LHPDCLGGIQRVRCFLVPTGDRVGLEPKEGPERRYEGTLRQRAYIKRSYLSKPVPVPFVVDS
jgi:hypothetical protein